MFDVINDKSGVESPIKFVAPAKLPEMIETAISTVMRLIEVGHVVTCGFSGGKDSTVCALLMLEAIRRCNVKGVRQPTHYISSSSTSVENPQIEQMMLQAHSEMTRWVERHNLPVEVCLVEPNPASKFVVSVIGRGTLPRFPENGKKRTCSQDWKVKPQQRLAKKLMDEAMAQGDKETVVILGTRLDESTIRGAAMTRRGDQAQTPNRNDAGFLTLSLIASWSESDVWEMLVMFLDGQDAPFDGYAQGDTIRIMLDTYRSANEGTCGMFLKDGAKAPCGSRFGCWCCTVTGEKDRSMESMLENEPKYEYMRGLSRFRNFLMQTQWDLSRRELVGRKIGEGGYLPVRPDVYSLEMRKTMLRYLLTLDELERERAEQVEADMVTGKLPKTAENIRMSEVQFEIVKETDLVLIDFFWGLHQFSSEPYPALNIWYQVKTLGRRYLIEDIPKAQKAEGIPAKRWFHVGQFDKDAPTDGLRSYDDEMWNKYRHPERVITHRESHGQRVVWFTEEDTLSVDATEAVLFIDTYCQGAIPIEAQNHYAIESSRFWLNEAIIHIPEGMIGAYQRMAKRGQYFAHLIEKLNLTPSELNTYITEKSISDAQYAEIVGEIPDEIDSQLDLF